MISNSGLAHGPEATASASEAPLTVSAHQAEDAFVPAYLQAGFWGEAYMLGPNVNTPMDPEAAAPAVRAVARAQEAAEGAGPKEKALIAALAARYSTDAGTDRAELNRAYADAMAEVWCCLSRR